MPMQKFLASLIIATSGSLGATIGLLLSRYIFRDFIELKCARWLKSFNALVCTTPFFTIFAIRLIPIFPFFAVNLLAGVTHMSVVRFLGGTFLGMLPSTYLYSSSGLQLSQISTINEILTVKMVVILSCLGCISACSLVLKKRFFK